MKKFKAFYTADFGATEQEMLVLGTTFTDAYLMAYIKLPKECIIIHLAEVTE